MRGQDIIFANLGDISTIRAWGCEIHRTKGADRYGTRLIDKSAAAGKARCPSKTLEASNKKKQAMIYIFYKVY